MVKNEVIHETDVITLRPQQDGIPASSFYEIIGRAVNSDLKAGTLLKTGHLK